MEYSKTFEIRWADVDPNLHMRHTAYADFATHVRFSLLVESGFNFGRLKELNVGPVIFVEKTEYLKEVQPDQKIKVSVKLAGLSTDGRKFRFRHYIFREDGVEAARITVDGAWMNLETRKLTAAPAGLSEAVGRLDRTEDFASL